MASGENLGAKFTLDITNLKAGLAEANKLIRNSESAFVEAAAGMDDWTQSADGLAMRTKSLSEQIDVQKAKISALIKVKNDTIQKMKEEGATDEQIADATDKVNKQLASEQKQLDNLNGRLTTAKKNETEYNAATNTLNGTIDKQQKELDGLKSEYVEAVAQYGKNSKEAKNLASQITTLSGDLAKNKTQYNDATSAADELDKSLEDLGNDAGGTVGGFSSMTVALGNLVTQGINIAAGAIKNFAADVMATGQNFESSMSNVAALSGATGDDLSLLEDTAREYGATTQFSASEAADALGYMALAGWDAQQSSSALGGVLSLAAAGGMDLAEASDMVTDYLSAFNLKASDASKFSDMLAYAQANSNTTAEQLGEAYKNSAASLNAAGQDVETVTALLASMANQGLKGSEAGTSLNAVMRDMTNKMVDGKIAIGDVAVEVMDANGNYRDMTDILADVEAATDGLGDAERAAALQSTFTSESMKGLNLILNDGVDNAAAFEEELRNSSGAAEDMADTMNDNLSGDLKSLNSAFEEFQLTIYDSANAPLRDLVQTITGDVLPSMVDMVNGVEGADAEFGEAIGDLITNAITSITSFLPQLVTIGVSMLTSVLNGIIKSLPQIVTTVLQATTTLIRALTSAIPSIVSTAVSVIPSIISSIVAEIPSMLQAAIDFFMAIIDAIPTIIETLLTELPNIITTIITAVTGAIPQLLTGAISLLTAIVDAIPTIITLLTENMPQIITAIINGVTTAAPQLLSASITLLTELINAIPTIVNSLKTEVPKLVNAIKDTLVENWPKIKQAGKDILNQIVNAIPTIAASLKTSMGSIITAIKEGLEAGWDAIGEAGADLIEGLWNGINDMTSWIKDKIEGFGEEIVDDLCDFFGIQSPSKLMRDVVGKNLALGVGVGFDDEMTTVAHDMQNALDNAIPSADVAINATGTGSVGGSGTGTSGGVVVYQTNNYSQQHSRYEIYKTKQQTAAAVRAAIAGV